MTHRGSVLQCSQPRCHSAVSSLQGESLFMSEGRLRQSITNSLLQLCACHTKHAVVTFLQSVTHCEEVLRFVERQYGGGGRGDVPRRAEEPVNRLAGISFELLQCEQCLSFRLASERTFCCGKGDCIISFVDWPDLPLGFQNWIMNTPSIGELSREVNRSVAYAAVGVRWDVQKHPYRTGWVYRACGPKGPPTMYGLHGQTIRRVVQELLTRYETSAPQSHARLRERLERCIVVIRNFLAKVNPMGRYLRQLRNHVPRFAAIHEDESTKASQEPHILIPPTEKLSIQIMEVMLRDGSKRYFGPASRLSDVACYPLFFPCGLGGWHCSGEKGETTDEHESAELALGEQNEERVTKVKFTSGRVIRTLLEWYKYSYYQRQDLFIRLWSLYQQYTLDLFSRWQQISLHYLTTNENVMNALRRRIARASELKASKTNKYGRVGRPFLVPASVPNSPLARRMQCREALAVACSSGAATHWITFTAKPSWAPFFDMVGQLCPESTDPKPEHHPHIVIQIYRVLRHEFLRRMRKGVLFPSVGQLTYVWHTLVDEFQTKYWPHFHLLCRLLPSSGVWNTELIDNHVSARLFRHEECESWEPALLGELNQHEVDPFDSSLFKLAREVRERPISPKCRLPTPSCAAHRDYFAVKKLYVHNCMRGTSSCMVNGRCRFRFPFAAGKSTTKHTFCDAKGSWHLRRPHPDDANIATYSRDLLDFGCHINVVMASHANSPQYFMEYQHKGAEYSTVQPKDLIGREAEELKDFQRMRHIGFAEAHMRLMRMDLRDAHPSVTSIMVHMPGQQSCIFDENEEVDNTLQRSDSKLLRYFWRHRLLRHLKCEEYFSLYRLSYLPTKKNPSFADCPNPLHCLSATVPRGNRNCRTETTRLGELNRQRNQNSEATARTMYACARQTLHVARIETPSVYNSEKYALSVLLREFAATSFEELRGGYGSFAERAYAEGLFIEHDEFESALRSSINPNPTAWKHFPRDAPDPALSCTKPSTLRYFFCSLILSGASAPILFPLYWRYLATDLPHEEITVSTISDEARQNFLLHDLQALLIEEKSSLEEVGLPSVSTRLYLEERFLEEERTKYFDDPDHSNHLMSVKKLNVEQRAVFKIITSASRRADDKNRLFFLCAEAGSGKTFVSRAIASTLRQEQNIVICCAPSAFAANAHLGGMTAHKSFGVPVVADDEIPYSTLTPASCLGTLLIHAKLIIVDEISMLNSKVFVAIDEVLQRLMSNSEPFGGKCLLVIGDFRQLPPVVPNGERLDVLKASVLSTRQWTFMRKLHLACQMRATHSAWSEWLRKLGNGVANGRLQDGFFFSDPIPPEVTFVDSMEDAMRLYFAEVGELNRLRAHSSHASRFEPEVGELNRFPAHVRSFKACLQLGRHPVVNNIAITYRNSEVAELNNEIGQRVRHKIGSFTEKCRAAEEVCDDSVDTTSATHEFMSSYSDSRVPDHVLELYPGCLISLTRNLMQSNGLSNGNVFIVVNIVHHLLRCVNITEGKFYGRETLLFRIRFKVSYRTQFSFNRVQFPLKVAWAGTVHRFQGQTLKKKRRLLVDARTDAFCHSHAYVSFSRAGDPSQVIILVSKIPADRRILSIVFREFLDAKPFNLHSEPPNDEEMISEQAGRILDTNEVDDEQAVREVEEYVQN